MPTDDSGKVSSEDWEDYWANVFADRWRVRRERDKRREEARREKEEKETLQAHGVGIGDDGDPLKTLYHVVVERVRRERTEIVFDTGIVSGVEAAKILAEREARTFTAEAWSPFGEIEVAAVEVRRI